MPAIKRSAGVAPEVDFKECTLHSPPQKSDKAEPTGFENQRRRHQKSQNGGTSGPRNFF